MPQSGREREGEFLGDPGDEIIVNERLALDDEDMSLPWLESDDDELDEQAAGGKLAIFLAGSLLVLVLLVGGFWWLNNRSAQGELVADGSTIKAPVQPYKEAPEDAGGKTFAGTGDSSFAVAVGQTRPARLGLEVGVPKDAENAPLTDIKGAPETASPSAAAAVPVTPKGVGVQVGAYFKLDAAEAGWTTLTQRYEALSGYQHRVVVGKADIGTVYRLQAIAPDAASAHALCGRLRAVGLACQVKN